MEYNKYGYGPNGKIDPNRLVVSDFAHFLALGSPGVMNRNFADQMYADMNKQGFFGKSKGDGTDTDTDTDNTDTDQVKTKLVYNPATGAFERKVINTKKEDETRHTMAGKEGILSSAMSQQNGLNLYSPIQSPMQNRMNNQMGMANIQNPYMNSLQRYLDPRYRGGI